VGLFEDIGRKVETFKQQAESHSQERARAKCPECETLVYTDREDCPECGHESLLVRKSATEEGDEDTAETDSTDGDEAVADGDAAATDGDADDTGDAAETDNTDGEADNTDGSDSRV
jgi:hypothetical protein